MRSPRHDLSTGHLVACTPCRGAYFTTSTTFEQSNQPGGKICQKMAKIRRLVDNLETRRGADDADFEGRPQRTNFEQARRT
jgi:hypothetical protein